MKVKDTEQYRVSILSHDSKGMPLSIVKKIFKKRKL